MRKGIIDNFDLSIFTQNLRISHQSQLHKVSKLPSDTENYAKYSLLEGMEFVYNLDFDHNRKLL